MMRHSTFFKEHLYGEVFRDQAGLKHFLRGLPSPPHGFAALEKEVTYQPIEWALREIFAWGLNPIERLHLAAALITQTPTTLPEYAAELLGHLEPEERIRIAQDDEDLDGTDNLSVRPENAPAKIRTGLGTASHAGDGLGSLERREREEAAQAAIQAKALRDLDLLGAQGFAERSARAVDSEGETTLSKQAARGFNSDE